MVLVDGAVQTSVDAQDRGLHYGDGLFETVAVVGGNIRHWPYHWERLSTSCQRLNRPCPESDLLEKEIFQVSQDQPRCVVKLILTSGSGVRGYRPVSPPKSRRIVLSSPWPEYPESWATEGVRVRLCHTRLGENPTLAGMKHCNRLEQILARSEWEDEYEEGLMLDLSGRVIEGTMSNVFIVKEGALHTPDVSQCGVAGVMRQIILEQAPKHGISVNVAALDLDQVRQAQGMFLCNSLFGIWPVREFEDRAYPVPEVVAKLKSLELIADSCQG